MRSLLITSGVRAAALRSPDKTALTCSDGRRTYAELVERFTAIQAAAQHVWNLKHGDTVALVAPNSLEYIEYVAAFSEIGIAVSTINYRLSTDEVLQIIDDCAARLVIFHRSLADVEDRCAGIEAHPLEEQPPFASPYDGSLSQEDDIFSIPYTSGTTGAPKGVMISHRARVLTFYGMAAEYQCFSSNSQFLAIAPLCHGAGFAFAFAPLFFGGAVHILESFDAERVLYELSRRPFDGVFMVPTHFQSIFELGESILDSYEGRHSLRSIISNASALPHEMKGKIVNYFGEGLLHETYGSTEAGIVSNLRPDDQLRKLRCVGPAFVDTEIQIRDESGDIAPVGEPGELFSRGPAAFSGYWGRPSETANTVKDGWISVGDVAVRDEENYIYIVDRKSDMIISGGINIYPREIENAVNALDGVQECAAFGVSDAKWGEAVHCAIVSSKAITEDDVLNELISHLARFKLPRKIHFVDALPKNATGKILKRKLVEMFSVN